MGCTDVPCTIKPLTRLVLVPGLLCTRFGFPWCHSVKKAIHLVIEPRFRNWIELLLTRKRVYTQMTYFTEGCISLAGVQAHETQKIPSLGPGKSNWILRLFYGSNKPANDCDLSVIQIFILWYIVYICIFISELTVVIVQLWAFSLH